MLGSSQRMLPPLNISISPSFLFTSSAVPSTLPHPFTICLIPLHHSHSSPIYYLLITSPLLFYLSFSPPLLLSSLLPHPHLPSPTITSLPSTPPPDAARVTSPENHTDLTTQIVCNIQNRASRGLFFSCAVDYIWSLGIPDLPSRVISYTLDNCLPDRYIYKFTRHFAFFNRLKMCTRIYV